MSRCNLSKCLTIVTLIFAVTSCGGDKQSASSPSCQEALRITKEITPDMQKLLKAMDLPAGTERTKLMTDFIMSGAATRFHEEFCPAVKDCGTIPDYDQKVTEAMLTVCDGLDKSP